MVYYIAYHISYCLLLVVFCAYSAYEIVTSNSCHREWPSFGGKWKDEPPYWELPGCPNQKFSVNATRQCMRGRTLYAIGNSVGRQAAFGLIKMLGGENAKQEKQRDMCPKHETTWGESCHSEFAGVKVKYLFLQFMDGYNYSSRGGFPFFRYHSPDGKETYRGRLPSTKRSGTMSGFADIPEEYVDSGYWIEDNCIKEITRACLSRFFNGSTENDVLIFTLGSTYGAPLRDEGDKNLNITVDGSFLETSAINFKAHVAATFKGHVFRCSIAPLNGPPKRWETRPIPNSVLNKVNVILWGMWQPGSEEKPWYTIDQWAINSGRERLYNDRYHFNGPLTEAMLHQVLNILCPGRGDAASITNATAAG